jgi:hypothetical protein
MKSESCSSLVAEWKIFAELDNRYRMGSLASWPKMAGGQLPEDHMIEVRYLIQGREKRFLHTVYPENWSNCGKMHRSLIGTVSKRKNECGDKRDEKNPAPGGDVPNDIRRSEE